MKGDPDARNWHRYALAFLWFRLSRYERFSAVRPRLEWQTNRGPAGEWRWLMYVGEGWTAGVEDSSQVGQKSTAATRYRICVVSKDRLLWGEESFQWLEDARKAAIQMTIGVITAQREKKATDGQ
ncbi:hypothetical protein Acid345_3179 [Candidatus Koribacter versatilis Ellin345]|uniref:Uncharacterized protein n=1 Tax=Koribacter versatilis (strain Ellin345) TaxID=204669 RepID=Q1ILS0_KORVE|nr:hypothetical protein [Candidatus Koribacter versatilis]ABF42180.1 hypothetical protein Acid345_3179 [Candidatus Koribacter versatilis Ellin345]